MTLPQDLTRSPLHGGAAPWTRRLLVSMLPCGVKPQIPRTVDETVAILKVGLEPIPGGAQATDSQANTASTGMWSEGRGKPRIARSMAHSVLSLAAGEVAQMWSIRRPIFLRKAAAR